MDRLVVGVIALVLILLLAGCQSPSRGLTVGIQEVDELESDYLVTFALRNDADAPFHDVSLRAYDTDGDLACTLSARWVQKGSVDDPAILRRQTVCASAPVILVPTATEPCDRDPDRGWFADAASIGHTFGLYMGYANGTHHVFQNSWNNIVRCQSEYNSSEIVVRGQPPNRRVQDRAIHRVLTADRDVSLVMENPDRDWEQIPPEASREFSVTVARIGENESVNRTLAADSVPEQLTSRAIGVNGSRPVNESTYLASAKALLGQNLTSPAGVPGAGTYGPTTVVFDGGRTLLEPDMVQRNDEWQYRGVRYGGTTTHRTSAYVETDDGVYEVVLTQRVEWSRPAIHRPPS